MITATAPGRCGLIGNPTDMYGGSVISCSTLERATSQLDQTATDIHIEVSGESQLIRSLDDLEFAAGSRLNVAKAVLVALEVIPDITRPFHLRCETEIPMQAGLAGSTAILGTIVGVMLEHLGLRLNLYEVAELVRKIEYDYLGIVCGFQDHYMTTFGGLNYMDFRGKLNSEPQTENSPYATIEPLSPFVSELPILLAHTGVSHHSGVVHGSIRDRWLAGEHQVVSGNQNIALLARLGKKALLSGDWDELGFLMSKNHAIQRDLGGSGVSNERLISAALDGGAISAKLAGAGGGGTILALTLTPDATAAALMAAGADRILTPVPSAGLTTVVRT